jgi:hypothetical protein
MSLGNGRSFKYHFVKGFLPLLQDNKYVLKGYNITIKELAFSNQS